MKKYIAALQYGVFYGIIKFMVQKFDYFCAVRVFLRFFKNPPFRKNGAGRGIFIAKTVFYTLIYFGINLFIQLIYILIYIIFKRRK